VAAVVIARRSFGAALVDFSAVEPSPLFGIGEQVVGGRNRLEPRLRLGLARIEIRMKLLG
jgi:hypothetical protein